MSASVFPARAGMSPPTPTSDILNTGVPRASGDEPFYSHIAKNIELCSPRERG